jgi:hypothetical protein
MHGHGMLTLAQLGGFSQGQFDQLALAGLKSFKSMLLGL